MLDPPFLTTFLSTPPSLHPAPLLLLTALAFPPLRSDRSRFHSSAAHLRPGLQDFVPQGKKAAASKQTLRMINEILPPIPRLTQTIGRRLVYGEGYKDEVQFRLANPDVDANGNKFRLGGREGGGGEGRPVVCGFGLRNLNLCLLHSRLRRERGVAWVGGRFRKSLFRTKKPHAYYSLFQ